MTPIADMVEQMIADCVRGDIIVLAVRASELAMQAARLSADSPQMSADILSDERRERDRIRKAETRKALKEQREMEAAQANDGAASVTNLSADSLRTSADKRCDLSSLSSSVKGLVEEGSKEKKKEAVKISARGTRLSADAQITSDDYQFAIDAGMTPDATRALWVEFVDFWIGVPGQRGVKLNWSATWRNRVRAVGAVGARKNGQGNTHVAKDRSLVAAIDRAAEYFGRADGVGDEAGAPILRLIS